MSKRSDCLPHWAAITAQHDSKCREVFVECIECEKHLTLADHDIPDSDALKIARAHGWTVRHNKRGHTMCPKCLEAAREHTMPPKARAK